MNMAQIAPSAIRFSQKDISPDFTQGDSVHGVIDAIIAGRLSIHDFLPINVAVYNDEYYTENNRTLYVCRVLEYEREISRVEVNLVSIFYYFRVELGFRLNWVGGVFHIPSRFLQLRFFELFFVPIPIICVS